VLLLLSYGQKWVVARVVVDVRVIVFVDNNTCNDQIWRLPYVDRYEHFRFMESSKSTLYANALISIGKIPALVNLADGEVDADSATWDSDRARAYVDGTHGTIPQLRHWHISSAEDPESKKEPRHIHANFPPLTPSSTSFFSELLSAYSVLPVQWLPQCSEFAAS
jgi:hypothetical protein